MFVNIDPQLSLSHIVSGGTCNFVFLCIKHQVCVCSLSFEFFVNTWSHNHDYYHYHNLPMSLSSTIIPLRLYANGLNAEFLLRCCFVQWAFQAVCFPVGIITSKISVGAISQHSHYSHYQRSKMYFSCYRDFVFLLFDLSSPSKLQVTISITITSSTCLGHWFGSFRTTSCEFCFCQRFFKLKVTVRSSVKLFVDHTSPAGKCHFILTVPKDRPLSFYFLASASSHNLN